MGPPTPPQLQAVLSLASFPVHLLVSVFEHLSADDLRQLRLVSKDVSTAATLAVRELCPVRGDANIALKFPGLTALDGTGIEPETWSESVLDDIQKVRRHRMRLDVHIMEGVVMTLSPPAMQSCQLTSLRLGRSNAITFSGASAIGAMHSLRSVELLEGRLTDSGLKQWAQLTGLTSLSLRACAELTDDGLQLLGALSRLQEIDLADCYNLSDATLASLANLSALSKLDLACCDSFTATGLAALGRVSTLHTLLLPACWHVDDGMLGTLATALPSLQCLSLFEAGEAVTDAGLVHLGGLTGLTALDLGYSCWQQTSNGLLQLVRKLPKLRMLSLAGTEGTNDSILEAVASLMQLTSLDVSECQRVTAAGLRCLGALPALLEVNVGWNLKLPDEALSALPPSLTKLDLSYCCDLTDAALGAAASLPNLAVLVARRCNKVTDAGVGFLARCATLRQLDLSYCTALTSTALRNLSAHAGLNALVIAGCPRAASPPGLGALAALSSLQTLDVSNNPRLDDGCMQALSFVAQLQYVVLRMCPRISDNGLGALVRLQKLAKLDVTGCRHITPTAVTKLKAKLPLLGFVAGCGGATFGCVAYPLSHGVFQTHFMHSPNF